MAPVRLHLPLLIGFVALGPISTDLYLPSLPGITRALATDVATVQLTLSLFLVGFAACQLLYGPVSDRFGRRPVLLAGLALYLVATVACMLATTVEALIAARVLQAMGAAAGPVLGRAMVRDCYARDQAARVLAHVGTAMGLAPAIGPILGGFVEVWFGWRGNFALLGLFAAVVLAGAALRLEETNRALNPLALGPRRIASTYLGLLRNRRFLGYAMLAAAGYSGLFAFISGSSHVLIAVVGLTPDLYGVCFAAFVVGYMTGTTIAGRAAGRVALDRMIAVGAAIAALAGLAMALAAWMLPATVASVVGPAVLYMVGVGIVFPNATAAAMAPFPHQAGAASALVGFLQMGIAAGVGLAVGHAFDGSAVPMATAIGLAGLALVLVRWTVLRGPA